jgi:putative membrane protein
MTWWCSATGLAWNWEWRAYPGIWLVILVLSGLYPALLRRGHAVRGVDWHAIRYGLGVAVVWISLDWPLGPLGAGYLASAHAVSYILLTLVAAPLLLTGIPPSSISRLVHRKPGWGMALRFLARPLPGLVGYSTILILTHLPQAVDQLLRSQVGTMLIDLGWLLGGLMLWWPVLAPAEVGRLSLPLKLAYLFVCTLPPILPSAFLTFSDYPLYAVYELAPRVMGISARDDQQAAGVVMKVVGDVPIWLAFGIVFFRWAKAESAPSRAG